MRKILLSIGLLSALLLPPLMYAAQTAQRKQTKSAATRSQSDGERIFAQNCSHCHTAPDGFPPQISGTVVRHMRVRASLSAADERALLRFFNP